MTTHLYRSRDDRMLAGVAGGLAELWDADPSLVRLLWALLVILTGGIALVVYIVMAIVVPEEDPADLTSAYAAAPLVGGAVPTGTAPVEAAPSPAGSAAPVPMTPTEARALARDARRRARAARRASHAGGPRSGALVVGTLLVLLGAWFLVREYLPALDWEWFWPATLIVVGALVLTLAVRPRADGPSGPTGLPTGGPS
ncbi:MAG TPA: PspC domain-containing protein [Candidatus Limnocylindrales bacterium]